MTNSKGFTTEETANINAAAAELAKTAVEFLRDNPTCFWSDACMSSSRKRAQAIRTAEEILSLMGYKTLMSSKRAAGGRRYFLVLSVHLKMENPYGEK